MSSSEPTCGVVQEKQNKENTTDVAANQLLCSRTGCQKKAVKNIEWQEEYCSQECVMSHCKEVFTQWVKSNSVGTTATSTSQV